MTTKTNATPPKSYLQLLLPRRRRRFEAIFAELFFSVHALFHLLHPGGEQFLSEKTRPHLRSRTEESQKLLGRRLAWETWGKWMKMGHLLGTVRARTTPSSARGSKGNWRARGGVAAEGSDESRAEKEEKEEKTATTHLYIFFTVYYYWYKNGK